MEIIIPANTKSINISFEKEDILPITGWFVNVTPENLEVVKKWRSQDSVYYSFDTMIGLNHEGNKDNWGKEKFNEIKDKNNYIEISTEQFYKIIGHKPNQINITERILTSLSEYEIKAAVILYCKKNNITIKNNSKITFEQDLYDSNLPISCTIETINKL